jgi:hypothetical protein
MNLGAIVQGHVNEALGLNDEMSRNRLAICHKCPLYSTKFGGLCNNRLFLNPKTGDVSMYKKEGYKNGCGCRL